MTGAVSGNYWDVLESLKDQGWVSGYPRNVSIVAIIVDSQVHSQGECANCWGTGLRFEPLHRPEHPGEYRGLAHCRKCGHAEEV